MDSPTWIKIKSILRFALGNPHSSFYRKKYRHHSAVRSAKDFFSLPYLTREELVATPPFERLFFARRSLGWITTTSGTTNKELLIVFKHEERESFLDNIPEIVRSLKAAVVLCSAESAVTRYMRFAGRIPAFVGSPRQLEKSAAIAVRLGVDTIYATPDLLIDFLGILGRMYDLKKIRLLQVYGTPLSKFQRDTILKQCPTALLIRTYSSSEASAIAFQCEALAKKLSDTFHIYSDRVFIEILPGSGRNTGRHTGEIVVTHRRPMPSLLIRYRTGDLGRILRTKKCTCGIKTPLLKLFGRKP